jgi:hypothetical protein
VSSVLSCIKLPDLLQFKIKSEVMFFLVRCISAFIQDPKLHNPKKNYDRNLKAMPFFGQVMPCTSIS